MVLTVASVHSRSVPIRSATSAAVSGCPAAHSASITSSSASVMRTSIGDPFDYSCKRVDYSCKHPFVENGRRWLEASGIFTTGVWRGKRGKELLAENSNISQLARRLQ